MKKIVVLVMTVSLLLSALCVTALAADTPTGPVLRVSGEIEGGDGKVQHIQDYTVFDDGWNAAMKLAGDYKWMKANGYSRVVVDLLADWEAVDGEFTDETDNGRGFNWDAIYFYYDVRITLNMNGHTIDRGLEVYQYNGEVMYVDDGADVIINGGKSGDPIIGPGEDPGDVQMGTITGGFSCNGAGGIHINDDARVTLNNVCLLGNTVEDDKGSAIAMYDDAELTMNGGCMSNNSFTTVEDAWQWCEGTLYVEDAKAVLNKVTFSGNEPPASASFLGGLVVSMDEDSEVTMDGCLVENNGVGNKSFASSLFYACDDDCVLTITNTEIKNNGRPTSTMDNPSTLFSICGTLNMENCTVTGNKMVTIFNFYYNDYWYADIRKTTFSDNASQMLYYSANVDGDYSFAFTECTFNNNKGPWSDYAFDGYYKVPVTLTDCDLGTSNFTANAKKYFKFDGYSATLTLGSLFGDGSLSMVVAILALAASIAAIGVSISSSKKIATAKAGEAKEDED